MSPKWVIAIATGLIVVAVLALLVRKTVRAELNIHAAPEEIWSVLTDPSSYPDWNPIFVSIDGAFDEGSRIHLEMKPPNDNAIELDPRITKMVTNANLEMLGGIPGVFTFDHAWRLEAIDGGTRVIQQEEFRGIGALFFDPSWVEAAYRQANINLRDRVESR